MTKLLVSVRDGDEARAALAGGAQWIDVKEPGRGALGAGSAQQLADVAETVAGRAPLSAAMGELLDDPPIDRLSDVPGYSFVKVGMAGCARARHWRRQWSDFIATVPSNLSLVAVLYADYAIALAPSPDEMLDAAKQFNIPYLLIDTCEKSGGDLRTHLSLGELREIIAVARRTNLKIALAGSLTYSSLPTVISLAPDLVAVRGAACRGGRNGRIDAQLVRQIARQLSTTIPVAPEPSHCDFVDSDVRES